MDNYLDQYKKLHSEGLYGTSSVKLYDDIVPLLKEVNPTTVLDYGCGQSLLASCVASNLGYITFRYDPAIPELDSLLTQKYDVIVCIDVLEHIPEHLVDDVIKHIRSMSEFVIFDIGVVEAVVTLPNGDNAHCTVRSVEWWLDKLGKYFTVVREVKRYRDVKFMCKTW